MDQNCPRIPCTPHTALQAQSCADRLPHKKHTSLLRHMTMATKCTSFCSSQGLVRAPVNWEAILIFPLFMLWLWDYPFSHSFLKTTWDSSFPFSLFPPLLFFFYHPPPPPPFNSHSLHTDSPTSPAVAPTPFPQPSPSLTLKIVIQP